MHLAPALCPVVRAPCPAVTYARTVIGEALKESKIRNCRESGSKSGIKSLQSLIQQGQTSDYESLGQDRAAERACLASPLSANPPAMKKTTHAIALIGFVLLIGCQSASQVTKQNRSMKAELDRDVAAGRITAKEKYDYIIRKQEIDESRTTAERWLFNPWAVTPGGWD